jgi:hypothetical protein
MVIIVIFEFNNREFFPTAGYLQISKPDYPFRLTELNQQKHYIYKNIINIVIKFKIKIIWTFVFLTMEDYYQGRIQDLWLGGAWVGEGSGDRLLSPAGPGQNPGRGPRVAKPPWISGDFRNYRHLFERQIWTNHTIFIRPKKPDFES